MRWGEKDQRAGAVHWGHLEAVLTKERKLPMVNENTRKCTRGNSVRKFKDEWKKRKQMGKEA